MRDKIAPHRLLCRLVHLAQIHGLGRVAERRGAALRDEELVVRERERRQCLPHRLRLRRVLQLLEERNGALVVLAVDAHPELDQRLVKPVRDRVDPLVDNDLRAPAGPLDVLHVALDLEDGDTLWRVDRVPHAQVVPVLRDDDVRVGDPLHVARVVEQGRARLRRDVEQVQVAPLVAEQQLRGRRIELEPVNLGVVGDCCHVPRRDQV
mmetsp:Transcript_15916/g.37995  ORF Transcript_15916/g.37995 Transcript_15916/m.37995 type:complete len:208 (-) Transcript_15916:510-1133(-)